MEPCLKFYLWEVAVVLRWHVGIWNSTCIILSYACELRQLFTCALALLLERHWQFGSHKTVQIDIKNSTLKTHLRYEHCWWHETGPAGLLLWQSPIQRNPKTAQRMQRMFRTKMDKDSFKQKTHLSTPKNQHITNSSHESKPFPAPTSSKIPTRDSPTLGGTSSNIRLSNWKISETLP